MMFLFKVSSLNNDTDFKYDKDLQSPLPDVVYSWEFKLIIFHD